MHAKRRLGLRSHLPLERLRRLINISCTRSPLARPGRTPGAAPTTARRSGRVSPARRRCGASRGASPTRSSGASWRISRQPRAAPLDKVEPRTPLRRSSRGSLIYLIAPVRRANSMGSPNTSGGYYQSLMYRPRHKVWVLPEVGEEHGPRARTPSQAAVWLVASSPSAAMAARIPPLGISGSPIPHR